MALQFPPVDYFSETAPNVQIADVLQQQVREGYREPGARLPSIADIVGATGVNRQTAAKALRLLGRRGYARLSAGQGWFVPERLPREKPGHDGGT